MNTARDTLLFGPRIDVPGAILAQARRIRPDLTITRAVRMGAWWGVETQEGYKTLMELEGEER